MDKLIAIDTAHIEQRCGNDFPGESIAAMSMEARMSICNMAIEAGARAGMVTKYAMQISYRLH